VETKMEIMDRAQALETRGVAQKGRWISGSRPSCEPENREAVRGQADVGKRRCRRGISSTPGGASEGKGRTGDHGRETALDDYSVSLLEKKVMEGDIRSLKGREKWGHVLRLHLIPEFGDFYVDQIRRSDVEAWKLKMAAKAKAGELAPTTFNGWLAILKVITSAANGEFELDRDPAAHVATLDTSTHHTYTEEQPNSLTVDEVPDSWRR